MFKLRLENTNFQAFKQIGRHLVVTGQILNTKVFEVSSCSFNVNFFFIKPRTSSLNLEFFLFIRSDLHAFGANLPSYGCKLPTADLN